MNLKQIVGKRVAAAVCERDFPMGSAYAAQIVFDDGSALDISIEARYCDDAWLELKYKEGSTTLSPETKAELDGL